MKVMGLRVHPVRDLTVSEHFLPVCDLGAAPAPGQNTTNRNNRSQPLLNSYEA